MKMKELESRTGVGREAIRFYIREGLLPEPEKPKRNVAIYSDAHVNRIRLIRKLQDERFLPLSEIRTLVDALNGDEGTPLNFQGLEFQLAARLGANSLAPRSVRDLIDQSSLEKDDLDILCSNELVQIYETKNGPTLSGQDAKIALLWADLQDAGFDAEFGYGPEVLNRYKSAAEDIADEEVEQFFDRLLGTRTTGDAAQLAEAGLEIVEQIFSIFHTKAVLERVARRNAVSQSAAGGSNTNGSG